MIIHTQFDINFPWSNWKVSFLNVMTKYVLHKQVTIRKSLPWLTHALSLLFKKCDRLHQRAKTLNSPTAWLPYRKVRNRAVSANQSAKRKFFSNLSSLVKTPKEFWSVYHSLLGHSMSNQHKKNPHPHRFERNLVFTQCLLRY